jgi:hypothetical protein
VKATKPTPDHELSWINALAQAADRGLRKLPRRLVFGHWRWPRTLRCFDLLLDPFSIQGAGSPILRAGRFFKIVSLRPNSPSLVPDRIAADCSACEASVRDF